MEAGRTCLCWTLESTIHRLGGMPDRQSQTSAATVTAAGYSVITIPPDYILIYGLFYLCDKSYKTL